MVLMAGELHDKHTLISSAQSTAVLSLQNKLLLITVLVQTRTYTGHFIRYTCLITC